MIMKTICFPSATAPFCRAWWTPRPALCYASPCEPSRAIIILLYAAVATTLSASIVVSRRCCRVKPCLVSSPPLRKGSGNPRTHSVMERAPEWAVCSSWVSPSMGFGY
ncbi:hypothetical protein V6N11_009338 [Hibiscus sabdariffa]|uniref:Uncharacterized protein n=1 Tax=Hibiscus sabdariffa TaxID=183260 RepID=A0ABR2NT19_9ROSI